MDSINVCKWEGCFLTPYDDLYFCGDHYRAIIIEGHVHKLVESCIKSKMHRMFQRWSKELMDEAINL